MGWGSSTQRGAGRRVSSLPRKFVVFVCRGQGSLGCPREPCRDVQDFLGVFNKLGPPQTCVYPDVSPLPNIRGAPKGTHLRGQTEPKRRFSQIFADFCRFSPFPRKRSIWGTQIFAENRRFSQEPAGNR